MLVYPGGAEAFPNADGYLFSYNYFSDLGLPTTAAGFDNPIAPGLFAISLVAMAASMLTFYSSMLAGGCKSISVWGCVGAGLVSALGVIAVGFTPYTIYFDAHYWAVAAWLSGIFLATLCFTLVYRAHIRQLPILWGLMIMLLVLAYVAVTFYPVGWLPTQRLQKVLVYSIVIWFIAASLWRYRRIHGNVID